ncbi:hypothetical protein NE848_13680 [Gramella jeungdoensis]|uniref:Uncharacterized protein n=1 Tax=Gramella jeungdoensis TaxID=708091 RepID=A0ABT0Z3Y5_9FLAO|nr:hypothetical protein [Gramella jeungdoensis]MCM8570439.1 hypothetical protein [Gramella jeungdoensis]
MDLVEVLGTTEENSESNFINFHQSSFITNSSIMKAHIKINIKQQPRGMHNGLVLRRLAETVVIR